MWMVFGKNIDFSDNYGTINLKGGGHMQREYPVLSLSNYICSTTADDGRTVTNLQLQKILYYVQGYFMRCLDSLAFDEDIYNWQYGPVVPEAYFEYNVNLSNPINNIDVIAANEFGNSLRVDSKAFKLLHKVLNKCLTYSAKQLVDMTHREDPWKNTTLRHMISKEAIKKFFVCNDPLEIGNFS